MSQPPGVLFLDEIAPGSRALVGGKALALATLARLDLPVPPAFVVTTHAYAGAHALPDLPPDLHDAIAHALERLRAASHRWDHVIVRSSAPFEDSAEFSAAGQLESVIRPANLDSVLDGIRTCWAALDRPAVRSYYRASGGTGTPQIAVIVQEYLDTSVAGVLFTRGLGPATHPDALVSEASTEGSAGVTSGQATPDRYVIDRTTRAVLEESRAPGDSSRRLSPVEIAALAELGLRLEAHYGTPQDIEWGIEGDRLYILQARPVTVLTPAPGADAYTTRPADDSITWVSGFFEERFPGAVSPLTWTYLFPAIEQTALREPVRYIGAPHPDRLPILRLYQGRVYTNLAVFQMLYKWFPPGLVPNDARRFFVGGDVSQRRAIAQPGLIRAAWHVLRTMLTEPNWHPLNYRVWQRFTGVHRAALAYYRARLDAGLDAGDLLVILDHLRVWTVRLLRIHRWSINYAEVISTILRRLVARWTDLSPEAVHTYLAAAEDSPTRRTDRALQLLADRAAALGLAPDMLAEQAPQHPELVAPMAGFLHEFGHRSFCLDLMCPRYADDPAEVWAIVARLMPPESAPQAEAGQRRREQDRLRAELDRQLGDVPLKAAILRGVLFFAGRYVALREQQRFEWQRGLHLMRRAFTLAEARLIADGMLRQPGDIFFLRWDEITALLRGQTLDQPPAVLATARRRDFRRVQHAPYPRFLRGDQPLDPGDSVPAGHQLAGVGASTGRATGIARVILTPGSLNELLAALREGDILVTQATDPGWTPAFNRIHALVMSVGGQLSHGAIVAREYGIPAVVSIGEGVQRIQDGDRLLVDGDNGTVTILDPGGER